MRFGPHKLPLHLPIVCLIFCVSALPSWAAVATTHPTTAPATEEEVKKTVHSFFSKSENGMDAEEFWICIGQVDQLADRGGRTWIIQQFIIEYATKKESMAPLFIGVLCNKIRTGPDTVIEAAIPLLKSADPDVRNLAKQTLAFNLQYAPYGSNEEVALANYIKLHERSDDTEVSQLLFHEFPDKGLMVMARVHFNDDLKHEMEWANHLVMEAVWRERRGFGDRVPADRAAAAEQLLHLALRREWWARAYAAGFMQAYPVLADAGVLEKLRTDPDPRVRAEATRIIKR